MKAKLVKERTPVQVEGPPVQRGTLKSRSAMVAKARHRIATGFYDRPEVLEAVLDAILRKSAPRKAGRHAEGSRNRAPVQAANRQSSSRRMRAA